MIVTIYLITQSNIKKDQKNPKATPYLLSIINEISMSAEGNSNKIHKLLLNILNKIQNRWTNEALINTI